MPHPRAKQFQNGVGKYHGAHTQHRCQPDHDGKGGGGNAPCFICAACANFTRSGGTYANGQPDGNGNLQANNGPGKANGRRKGRVTQVADIHHIEHIHRKHRHKANGTGASHNQHMAHDAAGGKAGLVTSARRGGPVHSCSVWAVLRACRCVR
ncbi:hypothetical protein S1001342_01624 [Acetobacter pasteurianus subsp. pasteurianus]|uniref:Uncharacterized protein n=1 Tax=Acetobacter pasteurianus subsp. pasteurianus TaxID=481145 RepID=A0A1Y0XYG5_ACEPA|nr:hypothetical protein S1001342_01624 [Acetobacter pasteurianus subsp. pasteurianus]